jgi:hypothetical protein
VSRAASAAPAARRRPSGSSKRSSPSHSGARRASVCRARQRQAPTDLSFAAAISRG